MARAYGEEGIGLVDVTIAITVLLLVLVPAALLLASINSTSGSTDHRIVALGIASSYADEIQGLQANQPPGGSLAPYNSASPANYAGYIGTCAMSGAGACTGWPSPNTTQNGDSFPTQTVDGIAYSITAAGGWCQLGVQGGTLTSGPAVWSMPQVNGGSWTGVKTWYAPPNAGPTQVAVYGYWIGVRVSWDLGSTDVGGSVTEDVPLLPPGQPVGSLWPTLGYMASSPPTPPTTPGCPAQLR
ncbi:MAG TPA: hypothetical protein VK277_04365 [Acidimicrobiales bacterium]|nr:hypothetical protein [Acidimicrobiales bacterium]